MTHEELEIAQLRNDICYSGVDMANAVEAERKACLKICDEEIARPITRGGDPPAEVRIRQRIAARSKAK